VSDELAAGEWIGTWPPRTQEGRRQRYRVTSSVVRAGPNVGRVRLSAVAQMPGAIQWRRFGVEDRLVASDDHEALRQFFRDVAARARHRRPAR
jgi:hypothetical protein